MFYLITIGVMILGIILDQYTKYLAVMHLQEQPVVVIKDVFEFTYVENRGAAFGLFQNQQLFFILVASVALVFMATLYIRMPKTKRYLSFRICLLSIATGAIGNMIDRVRLNYVIDFFYFKPIDFPVFNMADIYASVATFALIPIFIFYFKDEDFDVIFSSFKRKKK